MRVYDAMLSPQRDQDTAAAEDTQGVIEPACERRARARPARSS
jgi:hypothetical protein